MIVTITAYKRPALLAKCLESIAKADLTLVSSVIVSLDWHSEEMYMDMFQVFSKYRYNGVCEVRFLTLSQKRLGVANHPRKLFNTIAEETSKQAICALEEDTIVSPDAFLFAAWALDQPGYQFVNLAGQRKQVIAQDVADTRVHEDWELRSPYGWAFTPALWRQLEPQWNGKIRLPYGWDWQLSHLCYRENWRCLTPEVARVYNTGREDGTYDTPANWDATQKDVVICQAAPNKYVVVEHERPRPEDWPEWVKQEVAL